MDERFRKIKARLKRYRKYGKERSGHDMSHREITNEDRIDEKPSRSEYKNVECFNCGNKRHFRHDCLESSHKERKALRAKSDKKLNECKAIVVEKGNTLSSSNSSSNNPSNNSSNTDDESQSLMVKEISNDMDRCMWEWTTASTNLR